MLSNKEKTLNFSFNTEELNPAQIRLIKNLMSHLMNTVTTDEEGEFFEGSAEIMKLCAALIQNANFSERFKKVNKIPYAEQALEYSVDLLQEHMTNSKVLNYDN